MTIWFDNRTNETRKYASKSVSVNFYPQHWKLFSLYTNGAKEGVKTHTCLDINLHVLGLFVSYTNWDYNRSLQ